MLFPVSRWPPRLRGKEEVIDVIIAEIRPEGKRETITETIREEPVVFARISTGQEGGWGEKPAVGGRTGCVPVSSAVHEAMITGSCSNSGKGSSSRLC